MVATLIILALSMIFFINGKLRSDMVALCALVLLMVFNILTPAEALSGFSNSVVLMMIGLFVVGGAIFKTGLAKMIGSKITRSAGNNELKLFILIVLVTAFIGTFVSNTGTVALMLPIVVSMCTNAAISPIRFLMPLAFASSMGGMITLIGTPPNLVIQETLAQAGFNGISFFSFTPVGIVCLITGLLVLIPLSKKFLLKKEDRKSKNDVPVHSPKALTKKYQLADNLFRLHVDGNSLVRYQRLNELNITQNYAVSILEIRRKSPGQGRFLKTVDQKLAGPDTEIKVDDILYVFGSFENVSRFAGENLLTLSEAASTEFAGESANEKLSVREIGIAEIVLMPDSKLINKTVKDSGFRDKYSDSAISFFRIHILCLSLEASSPCIGQFITARHQKVLS
ncbi:MAG: SLC13 family permease, partial [Tannerellaceae bacterium]|nr:SLC13 family permease [Tannerellaceae bacterium]